MSYKLKYKVGLQKINLFSQTQKLKTYKNETHKRNSQIRDLIFSFLNFLLKQAWKEPKKATMKVQIKITESRDNCSILTSFFFLDEEDNEDEAKREREKLKRIKIKCEGKRVTRFSCSSG